MPNPDSTRKSNTDLSSLASIAPVAIEVEDENAQSSKASARAIDANSALNSIPPSMDTLSESNSEHQKEKTKGYFFIGATICCFVLLGPLGGGLACLFVPAQFASLALIPFVKKNKESVWVTDLTNVPKDSIISAVNKDRIIVPKEDQIAKLVDVMKHIIGEKEAEQLGKDLIANPNNFASFAPNSKLDVALQQFSYAIETKDSDRISQAQTQVVNELVPVLNLSQETAEKLQKINPPDLKGLNEFMHKQRAASNISLSR